MPRGRRGGALKRAISPGSQPAPLQGSASLFSVHVVVAVDAVNLPPARVLLRSIRAHLPWWRPLRFHVVYSGDPSGDALRALQLERLWNTRVVPMPIDNPFENWGTRDYISAATLTRLLIPELLPRVDRVLYLDADTLAVADLSPLYRIDLEGKMAGGVPDFPLLFEVDHGLHGTEDYLRETVGLSSPGSYVNAGVLVMDLRRMRAENLVARAHALLDQRGTQFKFRDQDILNALLHDEVVLLDPRWNSMITMHHRPAFRTRALHDAVVLQQDDPFIVHYAGPSKPWHADYGGPHHELWALAEGRGGLTGRRSGTFRQERRSWRRR